MEDIQVSLKYPKRLNTGVLFRDISKSHYEKYIDLVSKHNSSMSNDDVGNYVLISVDKLKENRRMNESLCDSIDNVLNIKMCAYIAIVFSAMYLESEVFTYLAYHTSNSYAKDCFHNYSTACKWAYAIEYVTGSVLDRNGAAFVACDKLFTFRNGLVHKKSIQFIDNIAKLIEKHDKDYLQLNEAAMISQVAVVEMAKVLKDIYGSGSVPALTICE